MLQCPLLSALPTYMKSRSIRFGRPQQPKAKLPDTDIPANIESLSLDGRGVARVSGKTLFITGALPHEQVTARLIKQHKRFDEGQLQSIQQASPHRVAPTCSHAETCGGCQLQHLAADKQIDYKTRGVLELLKRLAKTEPLAIAPALTSTPWGYRRTARIGLNVRQRDNSVLVGYRRQGSRKLLQITNCPVLDESCASLFDKVHTLLSQLKKPKAFTHLELQQGDSAQALTLRTSTQPAHDHQILQAFAKAEQLNFYLQTDTGYQPVWEVAENYYDLPDFQLRLFFQPGDFLQINGTVNQQMVTQAISWLALDSSDQLLDLFCGLGNFSLPAAKVAGKVTGVEGSATMVERATDNARRNQIDNSRFYCADLAGQLQHQSWLQAARGCNKILLDPPRTGAFELLQQLPLHASHLLYIACDPAALARDSQLLSAKGYQLTRLGLVDMFPHTHHVESMALFEKAP